MRLHEIVQLFEVSMYEELLLHLRPPLLPDDAGDEGGDEEDEEDGGEDHDDADTDAGAVLQPAREPTSGQGEMCPIFLGETRLAIFGHV